MDACPDVGACAQLEKREARHACGAKRLQVGDRVCIFDGDGGVASAELTEIQRGGAVTVRIDRIERHQRPAPAIHLASAVPKGDRFATMLGMVTQLGISRYTPLACARSVTSWSASAADRARRIALEACKQSRRPYIPLIHDAAPPASVARQSVAAGKPVLVAHPGGQPMSRPAAGDEMNLMVGPEGGFTEAEIDELAEIGVTLVDLGAGTLRIETAAVALVARNSIATSPA